MLVPVLIGVAYLTLVERKVLAAMQLRIGPNVVGPFGLMQPFADALKMLMKETIVPAGANRILFLVAADADHGAGHDRLGGDPGELRLGHRRHQRGRAVPVRHQQPGRLWHHHCRLGQPLKIRVPGRAALGGADGQLRSQHGLRDRDRADLRRQPEPDRHRNGAAEYLVRGPAVPDGGRVLHFRPGGDQPCAFRPAGRRERDRRRLPRGITGRWRSACSSLANTPT